MKHKVFRLTVAALISAMLLAALGGCDKNNNGSESSQVKTESEASTPEASLPEESSEPSESSSETSETSGEVTERTWPCVSGTFMQPYAFTAYDHDKWCTHFDGLLEVGIDTFIIQWIAETPYCKFENVYYPTTLAEGNKLSNYAEYPDMLPSLLEAAEEKGIKVFVGLNISDEWWSVACTQDDWNRKTSELGAAIANEIYDLYKEKYPNALYGWYFTYEMYNGMSGYETKAGEFLNMYLEALTELDPSMPMLLSPFVRSAGGTAERAGAEWTKVFKTANFREGDIFCCQDAVGAGHITIDELDAYFAALKSACDTEPGLLFWANNEDFTIDAKSADVNRFIRQMQIASPYVSGYVTFAYSHYYSKDIGKGGYHEAYKHYYETGESVVEPVDIEVTYEKLTSRYSIGSVVPNNAAGIQRIVYSAPGYETYVKEIPYTMLDRDKFASHWYITPNAGDTEIVVTVTAYDYYGNVSEKSITITVE